MLRIVEAVQFTDTGRQREANEDSYFVRAPLFAVADGMGGAQAGEVASRIAAEAFEPVEDGPGSPEALLRETIQRANGEIFELARSDPSRSGMGTTLTAALVRGEEVSFGHVGDSRAYVYRAGALRQITNDHSLVEELRRQGRLTLEQAADHPQRSVITRALGPEPQVEVDTMTVRARPGDVFLLCSDGLTTMLRDDDVASIISLGGSLETIGRRLIDAANERGGRDNITVVLFRFEGADDGASAEPETLLGPSAEQVGLTGEAVRAGAASLGGAAAPPRTARARAARRPSHEPRKPQRRWPGRILKGVAALAVIGLIGLAAVIGARQVWFIGTDAGGNLALFRGLPYELPFGLELYSKQEITEVPLSSLPTSRRSAATDHEWRSQEDAASLLADLESAAVVVPQPRPPGNQGNGRGSGGGNQGGNGNQGGSGKGGGNQGGGGA